MIFLQIVNSLPHYPVAQADAQTFPLSLILNEIEVPAALTWRVDLGSASALACILRRLAAMLWTERFAMARAPSPAREPRALPGISNPFKTYHYAISRMMMLPLA